MKRLSQLLRSAIATVLPLVVVAACSSAAQSSNAIASLGELPDDEAATTAAASTTTTVPSARLQTCSENHWETSSYPARVSDDGFIEQLRSIGRIRVGLDENTRGLSARNSQTGDLEGFEVALAQELARRLFKDPEVRPERVIPIPLVTDEKTIAVADETVDITVSAVSMTCKRWEQVDFSREYYTAHQMFLVRSDSDVRTQADLDGRTVCVTSGSSSQTIMADDVPTAKLLPVEARTDCLVALQRGKADAYFGHDTFLYGMLDQDPTLIVRDLLDPEDTVSHYGIAVNRQHPELTQLLSSYLDDMIVDGTWRRLQMTWLVKPIGIPEISAPASDYRRSPGD